MAKLAYRAESCPTWLVVVLTEMVARLMTELFEPICTPAPINKLDGKELVGGNNW